MTNASPSSLRRPRTLEPAGEDLHARHPRIAEPVPAGHAREPGAEPTAVADEPRPLGLGRSFWSLFGAAGISSVGDGLLVAALPLLAATLTRSPLLISGVFFAQRLPWLLVGLPAGALADRVDRPRLMRRLDVGRAVLLGLVALAVALRDLPLGGLYALAFVLGSAETAFFGASHSLLPTLVARPALNRANGYLFAAQASGEQLAGPAVGGLLFAALAALPFGADALSFAASASMLRGVRTIPRTIAPGPLAPLSVRALLDDVRAGLSWFRGSRLLRTLAAVIAALAFTQAMILGILVLFALEDLHLSTAGYGLLLAVEAAGTVLGSLVAARVARRLGTAAVVLVSGVATGLAYLVAGATRSAFVAAPALTVEAFAIALANVATISLRQAIVPPELLARVGNVFRMVLWGVVPLGSLLGGALAAGYGLRTPFFVGGAAQALVVVVGYLPLRRLIRASGLDPASR